jgi:rubrerythrin
MIGEKPDSACPRCKETSGWTNVAGFGQRVAEWVCRFCGTPWPGKEAS